MIYPDDTISGPAESIPVHASMKQRVLVIEDQSAVCDMIADVVRSHPRCELIGKGGDGAIAVRLAQQLNPDILVLDMIMPGIGGIEVLYRLRNKVPKMKVLIFSGINEPSSIRSHMRALVHGFVHKNEKIAELRNALGALSSGQKWFKDQDIAATDDKNEPKTPDDFMLLERLTSREREVAILISQSHTSKAIAKTLSISHKTVENHRANLMRKLCVNDVVGLVRIMIRFGLC